MRVVVIIFHSQFSDALLTKQVQPLLYPMTASNLEKLISHFLATWWDYSSLNTNYEQRLAWPLILIYICIWTLHAEKAHGTAFKRLLFNKTIVDLSPKKWSIEPRVLLNVRNKTRHEIPFLKLYWKTITKRIKYSAIWKGSKIVGLRYKKWSALITRPVNAC